MSTGVLAQRIEDMLLLRPSQIQPQWGRNHGRMKLYTASITRFRFGVLLVAHFHFLSRDDHWSDVTTQRAFHRTILWTLARLRLARASFAPLQRTCVTWEGTHVSSHQQQGEWMLTAGENVDWAVSSWAA